MLEILFRPHLGPPPPNPSSPKPFFSPLYLHQFVDAKGSVQLGQLRLVFAAQEGHELLEQGFLVVAALRRGGRTQELVQLRGDAGAAGTRSQRGHVNVGQEVTGMSPAKPERRQAPRVRGSLRRVLPASHPARHHELLGSTKSSEEPSQDGVFGWVLECNFALFAPRELWAGQKKLVQAQKRRGWGGAGTAGSEAAEGEGNLSAGKKK